MEPCQFCGQSAAVDGAGFCTNCRNYRGVPAQPVSGPGYPTTGAAYPSSGQPYGGQVSAPPYGPVSGAPATGYQTGYPQPQPFSAPPTSYPPAGYPPAGYQPPAGMPPAAPPAKRNSFLVPVIALCSVLALLAIGIVVVVVVRHGDKAKPTPPVSSGFDQCLVGNWKVTDYTTHVAFDNVGDVLFLATDLNETVEIKSDGSATDNYGTLSNPTVLIGTGGSHDYEIKVYGTVTYAIRSANGVLSFSDAQSDGTLELTIDGTSAGKTPLDISSDPTPYTCSSTTFTQKTSDFTASATKQ